MSVVDHYEGSLRIVYSDPSHSHLYRLKVILTPDEDGCGFTAQSVVLPGVITEGDTKEEAIQNIKIAYLDYILACKEEGLEIPYNLGKPTISHNSKELVLRQSLDFG